MTSEPRFAVLLGGFVWVPQCGGRLFLALSRQSFIMILMTTTETVSGILLKQTAKAFFVRLNGSHSDCWIPKSQATQVSSGPVFDSYGDLDCVSFSAEVPAWLYAKLPMNWNDGSPIPYATAPW